MEVAILAEYVCLFIPLSVSGGEVNRERLAVFKSSCSIGRACTSRLAPVFPQARNRKELNQRVWHLLLLYSCTARTPPSSSQFFLCSECSDSTLGALITASMEPNDYENSSGGPNVVSGV